MVGLLDWELWSQAGHVAFACQALVVVYGQDVAGWGREFHGQGRGGDDCAKGIEGRTAHEDVVGCWPVDDKEADCNGFGLGSIPKDDVEVNVAPGGYLFAGKAIYWLVIWDHGGVRKLEFLVSGLVEGINRAALIKKDFLNSIIFDFNSDDHRVILLVVEVVEVIICEYDMRHTASMVGMGDVVDGLYMAEVSFSGRRGGVSACEAARDGVNGAL